MADAEAPRGESAAGAIIVARNIRPRARLLSTNGVAAWKQEAATQKRHRVFESQLHRYTLREMKLVARLLRHMRRETLLVRRGPASALTNTAQAATETDPAPAAL
jgi:hypothetical protein